MKRIFIFLCTASILFGGCSKKNTYSVEKKLRQYEFTFVCTIIDNEYWLSCYNGIQRADKELGTVTTMIGPKTAENFSVEIIDYMKTAVEKNPDGVMAYSGIEGMWPVINQCKEKNIPFIAMDSDCPKELRSAFIGTDPYNAGYKAGEELVRLTGGKAKIGVLMSSFSAEKELKEVNAFKDAILDYNMEIVKIDQTGSDFETAEKKAREMIKTYPEINAFFSTSSFIATGMGRVKKRLNAENLVIIGFDDTKENLELVKSGAINALVVQNPEEMGYRSVYVLYELVQKGGLLKDNYDTGIIVVNKANVENYKF